MYYYLTVRQFIRTLKNLDAILEKATRQAEARKFDVNNFFAARLFPDMLPFVAQIRIACDPPRAAANLAGDEAPGTRTTRPPWPSCARGSRKCVAYLETLPAADFERTKPDTMIKHRRARSSRRRVPVRAPDPELLLPRDHRVRAAAPGGSRSASPTTSARSASSRSSRECNAAGATGRAGGAILRATSAPYWARSVVVCVMMCRAARPQETARQSGLSCRLCAAARLAGSQRSANHVTVTNAVAGSAGM